MTRLINPGSSTVFNGLVSVHRDAIRALVHGGVEHQGANYSISLKPLLTACRQEIHNKFVEQQRLLGMQPVARVRDDPGFGARKERQDPGLIFR